MLKELVEKISELAVEATTLRVVTDPAIPETAFTQVGHVIEAYEIPPERRSHVVHGFDDFVAAVRRWGDLDHVDPEDTNEDDVRSKSVVFHDSTCIRAILDDEDRRDKVTLRLQMSDLWCAVAKLRNTPLLGTPAQIIRFIRFELCAEGTEALVAGLRKVNFKRLSGSASEVGHGSNSYGKSVEEKVQDADAIPDGFTVETSMYTNPGFRALSSVVIRVGVFIDTVSEKIELRTLPDEIDRCTNEVQMNIGNALGEELDSRAVFFGAP